MKLLKPVLGLLALACLVLPLQACITDQISAAYHVGTSASITRNQAITAATGERTIQDLAAVQINSCVATKSYSGICAPVAIEAVNKALVAARGPRESLLSFADQHAGAELGASGLYQALVAAKDQLVSVMQQYGYAVPAS